MYGTSNRLTTPSGVTNLEQTGTGNVIRTTTTMVIMVTTIIMMTTTRMVTTRETSENTED